MGFLSVQSHKASHVKHHPVKFRGAGSQAMQAVVGFRLALGQLVQVLTEGNVVMRREVELIRCQSLVTGSTDLPTGCKPGLGATKLQLRSQKQRQQSPFAARGRWRVYAPHCGLASGSNEPPITTPGRSNNLHFPQLSRSQPRPNAPPLLKINRKDQPRRLSDFSRDRLTSLFFLAPAGRK